jgi:anti-anti-sigma factor
MPHFEVVVEPAPSENERVLRLVGELDGAGAGMLSAAVSELGRDELVKTLALDMSDVSFVDSHGLRVLLATDRELSIRGAALLLRSVPPYVARLLRVTQLSEHFDMEEKR